MNTSRLRRGGWIASAGLFYSYTLVYFVCDSAPELERWALLPFLRFSCPNLLLGFSELVVFLNLLHIFFANVGTFSGSLHVFDIFCTLFWVSL